MAIFRLIDKRALLLWNLLLVLLLLCAQGVKLHVHNLDHKHSEYHSHTHAVDEAGDHVHLSKAHSAHDTSHNDHYGGVISEIEITSDGVLKNASDIFAIAVMVFFFTLVISLSSRQSVQRCRKNKLIFHGYYLLSPPLRAPPQY